MQREQEERLGTEGDVRLMVPAAPEYLRLVRLTAAGLASRMGFTFDEVEDLRIAVDELCFLLVGAPDGGSRTMELHYSSGPDSITIEGEADVDGPPPQPSELSSQILGALVDEHEVNGHGATVHFRLVKRREEV